MGLISPRINYVTRQDERSNVAGALRKNLFPFRSSFVAQHNMAPVWDPRSFQLFRGSVQLLYWWSEKYPFSSLGKQGPSGGCASTLWQVSGWYSLLCHTFTGLPYRDYNSDSHACAFAGREKIDCLLRWALELYLFLENLVITLY